MTSRRIEFEKLLNTRDLGGMTGADGRKIRPGKLYRSGHIYGAAEQDLSKLSGLIDLSVDFRSEQECSEKPEPSLPGVRYQHIPILEVRQAGVTRDEDSFAEVMKTMLYDAAIAQKYMARTYLGFITSDYSVSQYERFVRMLLEDHPKGVLWHCTAGKDRTGFASVIVQELLGVSREEIEEDYMLTNVCLEPEINFLTEMILKGSGTDPEIGARAIRYIFSADMEYLKTAYQAVEEHYGSFTGYLRSGLHITAAEQQRFRSLYLE